MNCFRKILEYLDSEIYTPNQLLISDIIEENQNEKYCGGRFRLSNKTVRIRKSKITPNKQGQFVAFWEKDINNNNQAYHYDVFEDLLVINSFYGKQWGQFIFSREILKEKGILKTHNQKGKMGLRVYPSWENPSSKIAQETMRWQRDYFIDLTMITSDTFKKLLFLYDK